jgi:hypothetical protein
MAHFVCAIDHFDFKGKGLTMHGQFCATVYWQRDKAGAIQHHGIKSAFYKPELDSSKLAKKRESPCGRESLQDRLVEALESSRSQKVLTGMLSFYRLHF